MPLLQTDRIYLRAPEPSDLDFLYLFENDTALWPVSLSVAPFSKDMLRQYLDNALSDIYATRQLRFMVCLQESGKVIGTIDLFDFEPLHQRAGLGIALVAEHRGRGYGQEALELLVDYARQTLQLHQLYCSVAVSNMGSRRMFELAGFTQIGIKRDWLKKNNGWEDVAEYQKVLK
ncbi:GNAT family N-acetyltransferase [Nibribacter ruber]|uniref:GNAT family N-acetyltransferase n=1 Tax=Nibribacter ruber TaxID=2698458 RepID=A0A6P1P2X1_9BACT|nr:GNAT family N-acetyltransferase [Nibribacter ruber]QHL88764.1 GNAT family N-acetyltransferase [Nibribacter ruber]